jgi:MFS family permease
MSSTISTSKAGYSFGELPNICKVLLFLSFVEAIGGSIAYHFAYFLSSETDFNTLNIGLLGFGMGIGSILGSVIGAIYTGKVQSKTLMSLSFLLMGIAFIMLTQTSSLYVSMVFVFLLGFGINLFITCGNSSLLQISKSINNSLTMAQSYKNVLDNAGGILAMLLIMIFAQNYFKSILITLGFIFIVLSVWLSRKVDVQNISGSKASQTQSSIKTIYKSLVQMLFAVFCIGLTYGIQKTVLGIHLNETIGNPLVIGFFFALDPLLVVLFQIRIMKALEKFNKNSLAFVGCILLGISTFGMGISSSMMEMFCSLIIFTLGEMLFMPLSVALCYQYGGANHNGLGIGAWRSAYSLGMMIGPLISGITMFYLNDQSAWIVSSVLCIGSGILVFNSKKLNY